MLATEIVKEIMKSQGVKTNEFARKIGQTSGTTCNRLGQKNISVDKLMEMLRVLDYKIVIVPGDRRVRDDEYEVTIEEPSKPEPKPIDLDSILPPKP